MQGDPPEYSARGRYNSNSFLTVSMVKVEDVSQQVAHGVIVVDVRHIHKQPAIHQQVQCFYA